MLRGRSVMDRLINGEKLRNSNWPEDKFVFLYNFVLYDNNFAGLSLDLQVLDVLDEVYKG